GKGIETELEFVEGMQFDKGYISAYFVTNVNTLEAVLENPAILIHEKKISSVRDLVPVLEKIAQGGQPLLILAEDVEGEALAALVINRLRGILNVCAVKAPAFGDRRKAILADIATVTGAAEHASLATPRERGDQVDDLQTKFLPTWNDVVESLNEAGAAGAGAGGGAGAAVEELVDLNDMLEEFSIDAVLGDAIGGVEEAVMEKVNAFKKFFNEKILPVAAIVGLAIVLAIVLPFIGIPLLLAAAIGLVVGVLWVLFHKPVIAFFKKSGKAVLKFVKKIWAKITGAFNDVLDTIVGTFNSIHIYHLHAIAYPFLQLKQGWLLNSFAGGTVRGGEIQYGRAS
ncbi:hypothetical protein LCGC14_3062340, partial [marine sediment metagenome]